MASLRKLIALDEDDLAVISAHVQDASVHIADIIWRPQEKRLVVGMKRIDWDQVLCGELEARRLVTALRFDRVLGCQGRKLSLDETETVRDLVGLEFHPGKAPGGCVVLMFEGGGALRLDVECIECELADLKECTGTGETAGAADDKAQGIA
ncbi:MAG: DUF2948 family protein [Xanthobacteraceae bacterium]|nr:DUF2948 family protein [Xanthobacteraceae bacterium]